MRNWGKAEWTDRVRPTRGFRERVNHLRRGLRSWKGGALLLPIVLLALTMSGCSTLSNTGVAATVVLTSDQPNNTATFGTTVKFTAAVTANSSDCVGRNGEVDFFDGSNVLSTGPAIFTSSGGLTVTSTNAVSISTLSVGTHVITAAYKFDPSSLCETGPGQATLKFTVTASGAPATHLIVSAPTSAVAGSPFNVVVTALDASNQTVTGYSGTVHFTSSDPQAVLPPDSKLANGTGSLSATLNTLPSQTITATDTVNATIKGTSPAIIVTSNAGPATHFKVTAPATTQAGVSFQFNVTALDANNNVAATYAGMIQFSSTDSNPTLPGLSQLTNGVGTFSATLRTAGSQSISGLDTQNTQVGGTSGPIAVTPSSTTQFLIVAPQTVTVNTQLSYTVTSQDAFGNTTPGYTGTIKFSSSDPLATLPPAAGLSGGSAIFFAIFATTGQQTITGTDTVQTAITGISNKITVNGTNPVPTLTSLSPANAEVGSAPVVLTITGTNFVSNSTVTFGANTLTPTPGSITPTQLTVTIPAAALVAVGPIAVTVTNPAPGGGASNQANFIVTPPAQDFVVTDAGSLNVLRFTSAGVPDPAPGFGAAIYLQNSSPSIAWGTDGLFYRSFASAGIQSFNVSTKTLSTFIAGVVPTAGMAFGPDGNLYVANSSKGSIDRYCGPLNSASCSPGSALPSGQSSATPAFYAGSTNSKQVFDLVFGPDGNLYVSNASSPAAILRYCGPVNIKCAAGAALGVASGDVFVTLSATFNPSAGDLAFGPDNNIYVGALNPGVAIAILRYCSGIGPVVCTEGAPLPAPGQGGAFYVPYGSFPLIGGAPGVVDGVDFDPAGNLYVSSGISGLGGNIYRFFGPTCSPAPCEGQPNGNAPSNPILVPGGTAGLSAPLYLKYPHF